MGRACLGVHRSPRQLHTEAANYYALGDLLSHPASGRSKRAGSNIICLSLPAQTDVLPNSSPEQAGGHCSPPSRPGPHQAQSGVGHNWSCQEGREPDAPSRFLQTSRGPAFEPPPSSLRRVGAAQGDQRSIAAPGAGAVRMESITAAGSSRVHQIIISCQMTGPRSFMTSGQYAPRLQGRVRPTTTVLWLASGRSCIHRQDEWGALGQYE